MNKLTSIFLTIALLISACATAPQQVQVQTVAIPRAKIEIAEPKPVQMDKIQWKVVKVGNQTLYTLDNGNFTNLVINMTKTKELLIDEKTLVTSYKSYYEDSEEPVKK